MIGPGGFIWIQRIHMSLGFVSVLLQPHRRKTAELALLK
eukprot:SAG11_NODE_25861_length_353_cov_0.610236_1_plen_38_part_01